MRVMRVCIHDIHGIHGINTYFPITSVITCIITVLFHSMPLHSCYSISWGESWGVEW
jgi:hypothetical protein